MKILLLTGGTGSLGRYLVRDLLVRDSVQLVLLIRATSDVEARARVEEHGPIPKHTEVYAGDLYKPRLGLAPGHYRDLTLRLTHILHAAASTRFNSPLEEARKNNVETTERVLEFAKSCGHLQRFGYLSTAFVAGKRTGIIKENEFEHNAGFNNTYQQTKYEAEGVVRALRNVLPVVIFRPPFVFSPEDTRRSGNTRDFLSILIMLVAQGKLPYVPGTKTSTIDIVGVNDTAHAVGSLFLKDRVSNEVFHLTNGKRNLTTGVLHHMIEDEKGTSIPVEYCGNGDTGVRTAHEKAKVDPRLEVIYKRAESFLSDPAYPKIFDNTCTLTELGITRFGKDPVMLLRSAVNKALWNSST